METVLNIGDAFLLEDKKEYQVYNKIEIDKNTYLVVRQVPVGEKIDFLDLEKFPLFLVKERIEKDELLLEKVLDEKILSQARKMGNLL